MSTVFNKLKAHALELEKIISERASKPTSETTYTWDNQVYVSCWVRRAHLDIIDVTDTKNLYMMHLCVFPHVYDSAPIYGFDIVAGVNKVTGAFLDFSPTGDVSHPMCKWFSDKVTPLTWYKSRSLPEWASSIFSKDIVAVSNINTANELDAVLELSKQSIIYYMDSISAYRPNMSYEEMVAKHDYTVQQNFYCQQQKRNPHTPRVLQSLGFTEELVHDFIHKELFPEI